REVDAMLQLLTHQHVRRRIGRNDVSQRGKPGVDRRYLNGVVVGMSRAGDLPHPKSLIIRLSRAVVALSTATEQVRFGDDRDERYTQIGTKRDRLRRVAFLRFEYRAAVQRGCGPKSRMHQKAFVHLGEGVDGVDG